MVGTCRRQRIGATASSRSACARKGWLRPAPASRAAVDWARRGLAVEQVAVLLAAPGNLASTGLHRLLPPRTCLQCFGDSLVGTNLGLRHAGAAAGRAAPLLALGSQKRQPGRRQRPADRNGVSYAVAALLRHHRLVTPPAVHAALDLDSHVYELLSM